MVCFLCPELAVELIMDNVCARLSCPAGVNRIVHSFERKLCFYMINTQIGKDLERSQKSSILPVLFLDMGIGRI